jgi:hypothetical protein
LRDEQEALAKQKKAESILNNIKINLLWMINSCFVELDGLMELQN